MACFPDLYQLLQLVFNIKMQCISRRYKKRSTHYYHDVAGHRLLYCFLPYFLFYTFTKPYHIGPQVTSTYLAARGKIGEFVSYIAFEVAFSTLSCKNVSMKFYYISATCNMM